MNVILNLSALTSLFIAQGLASSAMASNSITLSPGSCETINQAIQSLPKSGGTVQLLPGTYLCEKSVIIDRDNVSLIGAGSEKVTLLAAPGKSLPVLIIGVAQTQKEPTEKWGEQFYPVRETKHIRVHGVRIDGNYHAHSNPAASECYDAEKHMSLSCDNDGGKYIRNNGLTIRRAAHVRVSDLDTTRNFSGGIVLEKRSKDIIIDGFQANDNWFDGIAGYETSDSVFKNFHIEQNRFSGISIDMGFEGNRFENGMIRNNKDNGIFTANVGYNVFDKMTIEGNGNFPVYVDGKRLFPNWPNLDKVIIVPKTCENIQIQNSILDATKSIHKRAAVGIDHICQGFQLENVKMQSTASCVHSYEGAQVIQKTSSCNQ